MMRNFLLAAGYFFCAFFCAAGSAQAAGLEGATTQQGLHEANQIALQRPESEAPAASSTVAQCSFPAASSQAQIIAFGAYEGAAVSTSYIGTPDRETTLVDVTIEDGDSPLYILLTSYVPIVWRISGDTERVERIIASAFARPVEEASDQNVSYSFAGIAGVSADKVTVTSRDCLPDLRSFQGRQ